MPRTKKKSYSFSVGCQLIIMFVEGYFLSPNLVYIDKFIFSIYVYVRLTRSMGSVEAPLSVQDEDKNHFKSSTFNIGRIFLEWALSVKFLLNGWDIVGTGRPK